MKYLLLFLSFFCFLFSTPIVKTTLAQQATSNSQTTPKEPEKSPWQILWERIGNLISVLFHTTEEIGLAKTKYIIPLTPSSEEENFTNYNAKDKDTVTRMSYEKDLIFKKGTGLKRIIDGIYEDRIISYRCGNSCYEKKVNSSCSEIRYSHLIYHYFKKGVRILYSPYNSDEPIYYDGKRMREDYEEKRGYQYMPYLDSCFETLYKNMPKIPQGDLKGEIDAAGPASKELNNTFRTIIPESEQTPVDDNVKFNDPNTIEKMTKNNDEQQKIYFSNFIPSRKGLSPSSNVNSLKKTFTNYLHPASWQ